MSKPVNSKDSFLELVSSCGFVLQPGKENYYVLQHPKKKQFLTVTVTEIYGTWYGRVTYWDGNQAIDIGSSSDIRIFRIHLVDAFSESGYEWTL